MSIETNGPGVDTSRRTVLKAAAAVATAPLFIPASALGRDGNVAPSERVALGFVGLGTHGHGYNLNHFLSQDDAQVVALCDVFADRRESARQTVKERRNHDCEKVADFRDLLARDDIDAVVISTPDHWHALLSVMALEAGKDVMCEKPSLSIAEGREVMEAVGRHKAVFQMGLEDRSVVYYHRMCELVRNGAIGELERIDVKLPSGVLFDAEEQTPVPDGLDYEMWLGPAPHHPYTPTRTGAMQWRQIRDYSGGILTDWGAHLLDTAQVGNFAERTAPVEVQGKGVWPPEDAMSEMPLEYELDYRYANGVEMRVESGEVAIRFTGSDGWIGNQGWRGVLQASDEKILRTRVDDETNRMWSRPELEHRNFLDCIKSRQPTTYTAEDFHYLSTVMHIGNISMQLDGRKLQWDPEKEAFIDDDAANALRFRQRRDDWMKL
ncbi:MAG: Gfo/Idh/MocA family oxidoreductase [Phycisphaeraceae bacterium]